MTALLLQTVAPNNSFKPNLLRSGKTVAGKSCHRFTSTTQVGLIQALGMAGNNLAPSKSNIRLLSESLGLLTVVAMVALAISVTTLGLLVEFGYFLLGLTAFLLGLRLILNATSSAFKAIGAIFMLLPVVAVIKFMIRMSGLDT